MKFKGDKKLRLSPPNTGLALHSGRRPNTKPHYKTFHCRSPSPKPKSTGHKSSGTSKESTGSLGTLQFSAEFSVSVSVSVLHALVTHIVQSNCQFRPAKRERTWLRRNPNRETERATCCGNSGGGYWKDIGLVLPLMLLLLCSASLATSVQDYSRAPRAPEADNIRGTVIFRDERKAKEDCWEVSGLFLTSLSNWYHHNKHYCPTRKTLKDEEEEEEDTQWTNKATRANQTNKSQKQHHHHHHYHHHHQEQAKKNPEQQRQQQEQIGVIIREDQYNNNEVLLSLDDEDRRLQKKTTKPMARCGWDG